MLGLGVELEMVHDGELLGIVWFKLAMTLCNSFMMLCHDDPELCFNME